MHAGFAPFVAAYLVSSGWAQSDIGFVLSASGLVSLFGQLPGGALVDLLPAQRYAAGLMVGTMGAGALILARWTGFTPVFTVCALYALANCVLVPSMQSISLGLVGHRAMGERLARNARFTSIGSVLATACMGLIGFLFPLRFVFLLTAALTAPTLVALSCIRAAEIDADTAHGAVARLASPAGGARGDILVIWPVFLLTGGLILFHFANMPAMQLFSGQVAARSARWATVAVAAAVLTSHAVIAVVSPWVGRKAGEWGRRPLLLLAFAILAARLGVASFTQDPTVFVGLQLADGFSAAIVATVVPLTIADATRGTGHFGLALGIAGTSLAVGASAGAASAGLISSQFGVQGAFLSLALVAGSGLVILWALMPETSRGRRSE